MGHFSIQAYPGQPEWCKWHSEIIEHTCGICVVFPEPVSPMMMVMALSLTASTMSLAEELIGSSIFLALRGHTYS